MPYAMRQFRCAVHIAYGFRYDMFRTQYPLGVNFMKWTPNFFGHLFFLLVTLTFTACNPPGGAPNYLGNTNESGFSASGSTSADNNAFDDFKNPRSTKSLIYNVGPVDLPSGETLAPETEAPAKLQFQVSEPVWVIGFKPRVTDSSGKDLPSSLLHKAVLFNKGESNPVCPSGGNGNPFAVATSTLTPIDLPQNFGYPLLPQDLLEAEAVFHNPTSQEYAGVLFSFELVTIPMDQAKGYADVQSMLLDNDPCEHKPIALEPGAFVEKSNTFTLPTGGSLMVANAVLSDYGVAVSLTHQEKGAVSAVPFWRSEATLDAGHQILDLTDNPFFNPEGKSLQNGDKLTLGVAFDNFSNKWQESATGAAMIYLAPNL